MTKFTEKRLGILSKKDWSFPNESSRGDITDLHPYPARFIPPIPQNIISEFSDRKLKILDPFAGCGTTLRVGLNLGHDVIGIDVNGLANLLQRVYTTSFTSADLFEFTHVSQILISELRKNNLSSNDLFDIPNINHWFSSDAQTILFSFVQKINLSSYSESISDLLRFALSRVIVRISNQKSDTQYVAINKNLTKERIIDIIEESLTTVGLRFKQNTEADTWRGRSKVVLGDARSANSYKNIKDVDLIVTSPPYPNAYEYWLYHKYRMFLLGLDPLWARTHEIGARPFYSGTGKKNEFDFQNDLKEILEHLYIATKPEALQFWVIGDSIIKGRFIDNTQILTDASTQSGWRVINKMERIVNRNRSSFQGIGRQGIEHIMVLKKA